MRLVLQHLLQQLRDKLRSKHLANRQPHLRDPKLLLDLSNR
jgi:hypothetical protein